jgi:cell division protein FtsB
LSSVCSIAQSRRLKAQFTDTRKRQQAIREEIARLRQGAKIEIKWAL